MKQERRAAALEADAAGIDIGADQPSPIARWSIRVSLLLLHLLQVNQRHRWLRRLLCALNKDRPILGNRHIAVESRWHIACFNMYGNIEFAWSLSAEDTALVAHRYSPDQAPCGCACDERQDYW